MGKLFKGFGLLTPMIWFFSAVGGDNVFPGDFHWAHPDYGQGKGECRIYHDRNNEYYEIQTSRSILSPPKFYYRDAYILKKTNGEIVWESRLDSTREARDICRKAGGFLMFFKKIFGLNPKGGTLVDEISCGFDSFRIEYVCQFH